MPQIIFMQPLIVLAGISLAIARGCVGEYVGRAAVWDDDLEPGRPSKDVYL